MVVKYICILLLSSKPIVFLVGIMNYLGIFSISFGGLLTLKEADIIKNQMDMKQHIPKKTV